MENKILADTSVLIDLQKSMYDTMHTFSDNRNTLFISRIAALELIYGSRNKKELKINKEFVAKLKVQELEPEISLLAYTLVQKYGLKTKLGISDALIAATAVATKAHLWTNDLKHFQKIKEITLFKA